MLDVPDNVLPYFDFEAYGRDVRINEGGHFAPGGYVFNNGGSFDPQLREIQGGTRPGDARRCPSGEKLRRTAHVVHPRCV